jgi:serine protease AprX
MARSKYIFTLLFFACSSLALAQQQTYFVAFKDKASNVFSITQPEQFLTAKALLRRQKCKVLIDDKDLPVTQTYLDQIQSTGAQLLYPLKWLNGVVVRSDATVKSQIAALSFVKSTDQSVKYRTASSSATQNYSFTQTISQSLTDYSFRQKDMLGMTRMKSDGYNGSGVLIAITDDGFLHADTMKVFEDLYNNNQILDTWDIVDLDKDAYSQGGGHGSHVFSILAGNLSNQFSGPAQGADFILFRTEDTGSESPLEELNWIRAAEMADSLGADIIQVSLGYNTFDDSSLNYTQSDLNGETSYVSRGADVAATRGIVVVVSAGNYGNNSWGKILCPADAKGILSVGAVDANEERAAFSSIGYSADGRVKPDVMAMGANVTYVNNATGNISYGSGTSFASPLISGLCSGLMQAYPQLTHEELIRVVKYSCDRFEDPNAYYGYGIPDYEKASDFARLLRDKESELVFPNPFGSHVYIKIREDEVGYLLNWKLYTVTGELLREGETMTENSLVNLFSNGEALSAGLYCLRTSCNGHLSTFKLIK